MISDSQLPELKTFRKIEKRLPYSHGPKLAPLASPSSNETRPVHRWFRFKESFSAGLVHDIILGLEGELGKRFHMLDPFCGVGTSIVAAQELTAAGFRIKATGIEHNPFIAFVARTKAAWPFMDGTQLMSVGSRALDATMQVHGLPALSSIRSERCISRHLATRIIELRDAINEIGELPVRDALLVGLASAIEPLSRTRKDGRALRLVERHAGRFRKTIESRWQVIADDLAFLQGRLRSVAPARVLRGDGRRPPKGRVQAESVDLILTSPPYPNNIDYTEVYKLELWLLDFVRSRKQFFELRRRTFRSHPTAGRREPAPEFLSLAKTGRLREILWPLIERTESTGEKWRSRLLLGYFEDLWVALGEYAEVLRPEGRAVFVVGNSLHGGESSPYLVATDLALAAMAPRCGFGVEKIVVVRTFKRRLTGNHFLRESVVVLKKNA